MEQAFGFVDVTTLNINLFIKEIMMVHYIIKSMGIGIICTCLTTLLVLTTNYQCELQPRIDKFIDQMLAPFTDKITEEIIDNTRLPHVCRVNIEQGVLQSNCLSSYWRPLFQQIPESLPDMKFVISRLDEPRVFKNPCKKDEDWKLCACDKGQPLPQHGFFIRQSSYFPIYEPFPLFSSSSYRPCFLDIIIPSAYHATNKAINANEVVPWDQKIVKAFWRGGVTGGAIGLEPQFHHTRYHRQRLVKFCLCNEDCDAKFANYKNKPELAQEFAKTYGPPQYVQMKTSLKYKVIIDIDGNTYSGRFPALLSYSSVIFKIYVFEDVGNIFARAWEHYIPVHFNLSDFQTKMDWVKRNDKEAQKIAERGRQHILNVYDKDLYRCYMFKLLQKYGALYQKKRNLHSLQQPQ